MFYCYIVYNEAGRTYNGYTVNLTRRLRQHNGELKGGARATRGRGPWRYLMVLTCSEWDCVSTAMKHEWSIKYPTRKRPRPKEYNGPCGRLESMKHVFHHIASKCLSVATEDESVAFDCYVEDDFRYLMDEVAVAFSFVTVRNMGELDLNLYDESDIEHGDDA